MTKHSEKPLRLFVDPFAAWREFALKTAEMIAASACAGAARASAVRVAVIDEREPARAPRAKASPRPAAKARGRKKPTKRAKRR